MNNAAKTPLEELNLTDRFLFAETMDEPEAYEAMVGILLENEIELLEPGCSNFNQFIGILLWGNVRRFLTLR